MGFIDLVEAVEDVRQVFLADADARIADADAHNVTLDGGTQRDRSALGRIFERIIQQGNQHLLGAVRIAGDVGQGFGNIVDKRLLIILRVGGIGFMDDIQQGERRKDAPLQGCRSALQAGKLQHIVDQPRQTHGFAQNDVINLLTLFLGLDQSVAQRLHQRILALSGRVRYETEYAALAPAAGLVAEVYVSPGERVLAGQPLFRMDGTMQEAAISARLSVQDISALSAVPQEWSQTAKSLREEERADSLALSQAELSALTVRAQVDGLVQQVNVTAHSGVAAGTVAMALSGEEQRVVITAALRDAEKLQAGQHARILSQGEALAEALVERIGPAVTDASTGQVTCEIVLRPDQRLALPLGAQVDAEVMLQHAELVPVLPVTAITQEDALWWVSDGRAWAAEDTVIAMDDASAWVALPEGTAVVVSSDEHLYPGCRVREVQP